MFGKNIYPFFSSCYLAVTTLAAVVSHKMPVVDLGYAKYQGASLPVGVDQFLGMRYAAPPLGDLRFRAPQDPLIENGITPAISPAKICLPVIQPFVPPNAADEDCLFIDVFRPSGITAGAKLPVMIWFQGGAFITNFNGNYNGTGLVKAGNVIVVNINYRVGPYGFLASEEVRQNGDLNAGLHDQRKALDWVQKHVTAFGGNPKQVTMFGTSVGAGSVLLHTLANNGAPTDLFARGIVSDPYMPEIFPVNRLEFQYQQLLNATNCSDISCLRALSSAELQKANIARPYPGESVSPLFSYTATIDSRLIHDRVGNLLDTGKFLKIPLLFGSASNDGTLFTPAVNTTTEISQFLIEQYPDLTVTEIKRINQQYAYVPSGEVPNHAPLFGRTATAYGDSAFLCPTHRAASVFSQANSPVYLFRQNILDSANIAAGLGAFHTWETGAVWGPEYCTNYAAPEGATSYNPGQPNNAIISIVQSYWLSFVRSGDPNTYKAANAPVWEPFTHGKRLRLQTNNTGMEIIGAKELGNCAVWHALENSTHH